MNATTLNYVIDTLSNSDSGTTDLSSTVSDITNVAGAIDEHGLLVIIAATFIIFTVLIFLLFIHMNNTMIKTITKQLNKNNDNSGDLANKLVDYVIKDDEDSKDDKSAEDTKKENPNAITGHPKHGKDLVKLFINRETVFKSASKIVFDELKCSRIGIYVFHNGNETPYGLPFIKMSCIFDQGPNGIKTQRGLNHINLPLHYFNSMIECLYNSNEYYVNVDATDDDDCIRSFVAGSTSKSSFCMAIENDDTILGFISCEFTNNVDFGNREVVQKIHDSLHDMATSIKYIIINRSNPDQLADLRPED